VIAITLLLFALPAVVVVVGVLVYLLRGGARHSAKRRRLTLIALSVLGALSLLVGLTCLGGLGLGLIVKGLWPSDDSSGDQGRWGWSRPGRTGYADNSATEEGVRRMQLGGVLSLKCTNGWVPVYGGVEAVQSFQAPRAGISTVDFRAARKLGIPHGALTVSIRDPKSGRQLCSWQLRNFTYGKDAVTRFFGDYSARFGGLALEPGRRYELVFSSPKSVKGSPWLVNCFYRDTCPGGRYSARGRAARSGASRDLAFRLVGADGEALVSSIPKDADMGRREHFGLAYSELLKRMAGAVKPPVPGSDPSQPPTSSPLAAPGPKLTRQQALAKASELGKPGGAWPDPFEPRLSWIPLEKKFLVVYDSREGSLSSFADFLKMVGRKQVSVRGLAFTPEKVWAATSRGALVYDRRTRAWSQLAVNLDAELLEADVTSVRATQKCVIFGVKGSGRYSLELETNKWSKTNIR
jgi:hypothetical protein